MSYLDSEDEDLLNEREIAASVAPVVDPEKLRRLQEERDRKAALINLAEAGSGFGAALASPGQKYDSSYFDKLRAQSDKPVQNEMQIGTIQAQQQRNLYNYLNQKAVLDERRRHNKIEETNQKTSGAASSPGQKAFDVEAGKDLSAYIAGGGAATAKKGIEGLESVIKSLEANPNLTGSWVNALPEVARSKVAHDALATEQQAHQALMGDLKHVFGGNLSDSEREVFFKSTYNPLLPAKDNLIKLKGALSEMKQKAASKEQAYQQFKRSGGSLSGFTPESLSQPQEKQGSPSPGEEHDGYVFLGGDPSDQKSWRKK